MTAMDAVRSPLLALGPVLAAPAAVRLGVLLGRPVEAELEGVGLALVAGPDDVVVEVELLLREGREVGEIRLALEDLTVLRTLRGPLSAGDLGANGEAQSGVGADGEADRTQANGPSVDDPAVRRLAAEIAEATWLGLADAVRTLTGESLEVRVRQADGPGGDDGGRGGTPLLLAVRVRDLFQTSVTVLVPTALVRRLEQAAPPPPTVARPLRLPTFADAHGEALSAQAAVGEGGEGLRSLARVRDVPITITVELGRTVRRVEEILSIAPGTVLELDRLAGEPLDIYANQEWVARGEVVVVDENFAVRITQVGREPEGEHGEPAREGDMPWGPR